MPAHEEAVARLRASYDAIPPGQTVRLAKKTSNLFRPARGTGAPGLDVSGLGGVVSIDVEARTADVQGMCTYEHLVDATLPHGLIPYVVPQLRTITLGGAVSGLGIESTSFRNGLPHESVVEMDIFTGAGEVVTTRPGDELFDTFPNSYGSLGYATRLRIRLEPVPSYVSLRHVRFDDAGLLAKTISRIMETKEYDGVRVDGLDGTAFAPGEYYLTLATWTDTPTVVSTGSTTARLDPERLHRPADLLPVDPAAGDRPADDVRLPVALGHRLVLVLARLRRPAPRRTPRVAAPLQALRRLLPDGRARPPLPRRRLARPPQRATPRASGSCRTSRSRSTGSPEFLDWFDAEVGMRPVWLCPLIADQKWPTYPLAPRRDLRQRRLLGQRRRRSRRAERAPQPRDRGEGARARRPQVALLRGVLRPRDVRPAVRRRQPGAASRTGTTRRTG